MTFEEWLKWTRGAVGSDSPECMAKWAWKYQQMRINELEDYIQNTDSQKRIDELEELLKAYNIKAYSEGYQEGKKECLFDTQEEHDRYELEQAILSCWSITDDLHLLADAMESGEHKRMHHEMLLNLSQLYELKFQKLFKDFEKFTGCY